MFIRTNSLGVPNVHRRTRNMGLYFRLQMAAKASDGFIIRAVSNLIKVPGCQDMLSQPVMALSTMNV